jgi:hypothetical protein
MMANSAVLGLYVDMRGLSTQFTNSGMSVFGGLSADEIYNTASNSTYDPFLLNALLPTTGGVATNFYTCAYKGIYRINTILEGLGSSTQLTDSLRKQLEGEMKFARAFFYFYLTNLFGDVPLVTHTSYQQNATLPRTPVTEVYNQILSDLNAAKSLLATSYATNSRARPNKWVASALLAKVNLYLGKWSAAEMEATEIINSGMYSLNADLNSVFLIPSLETLWQLPSPNETINTAQGGTFVPSSTTTRPNFAVTDSLLNNFESGDQRRLKWLKTNTVNSIAYTYPFKYKSRQTASPVAEYNVVFRLAELYLIRGEAAARMGHISAGADDLNKVRIRAGLPSRNFQSADELLSAISRERRIELFTEWGNRWFDLKRSGMIDSIMTAAKGSNWQATDALYPIPQAEIELNPFLTQNPGY